MIALQQRLSLTAIFYMLKSAKGGKLTMKNKYLTEIERYQIEALYRKGHTVKEIAVSLGRLIFHQLLEYLIRLICICIMYIDLLCVISDTFQDFPINLLLFFRQLPVIVFFCVLFCHFGYFLIRNLFLFIGNKLFHIYVSDSLCCRDPYE